MATVEKVAEKKEKHIAEVDRLVKNAQKALEEFMEFDQEQIDRIVKEMAMAANTEHMRLSKLAVTETKKGVMEDKVIKNLFASEYVYNNIKHNKTVGVIKDDPNTYIVEIAEPVGVIAGVTPVTNPTSTTIFKSPLR